VPCYKPMSAYYARTVNTSGKRSLVFDPSKAFEPDNPIEIACGQCIGCRLERSRQWATRCMHEAQLHDDNAFLTLTFDDEHLFVRDNPWSLDVTEFQRFIKRYRKHVNSKFRYFHCGEYGSINQRPHYHAIIFGHDFLDREHWSTSDRGDRYYVSQTLQQLWPYGFSVIGDVTFESCAYVARYVVDKVTGDAADEHYYWVDEQTGEFFTREPEYTTMSRRPGIGNDWYKQFKSDCYPSDFITVRGNKCKVPKYYDKLYEIDNPVDFDLLKEARLQCSIKHADNNTYERLVVREKVKRSQIKSLNRKL
jgi:hypothetical protein